MFVVNTLVGGQLDDVDVEVSLEKAKAYALECAREFYMDDTLTLRWKPSKTLANSFSAMVDDVDHIFVITEVEDKTTSDIKSAVEDVAKGNSDATLTLINIASWLGVKPKLIEKL